MSSGVASYVHRERRRVCRVRRVDAGGAGERGDVVEADLLTQRDGRVVERVREREDGRSRLRSTCLHVVAGVVGLATVVEGEGGLDVMQDGELR